jgi:hypothetical protein
LQLGLASTVIQNIEQAVEGCICDLHLWSGWQTGECDSAGSVAEIAGDLRAEPSRGLELARALVVLERKADQVERSWGDEALNRSGVRADVDGDAQIFDPSGGQLKELLSLSTGDLSGLAGGWETRMR